MIELLSAMRSVDGCTRPKELKSCFSLPEDDDDDDDGGRFSSNIFKTLFEDIEGEGIDCFAVEEDDT